MKISIIMPVYNAECFLERSIQSVIKQSFRDWELLLIDDGSKDKSATICKGYAEKDKRILFFQQKHKGQAAARNLGLKKAGGEYIAFLDADDYMHASMLDILYNNIISTETDIAVADYAYKEAELFSSKNAKTNACREICFLSGESHTIKDIQQKANVYLWNKLYKKELFEQKSFPEKRFYEDTAIMHLLFEQANNIVWDSRKLYFYYQNSKGTVNRLSKKKIKDCLWAYSQRIDFYYKKGYVNDLEHAMHVYLYKAYKLYGQVTGRHGKNEGIKIYIRKMVKHTFERYKLEEKLPFHGKIRYKAFIFYPPLFELYTKLKSFLLMLFDD